MSSIFTPIRSASCCCKVSMISFSNTCSRSTVSCGKGCLFCLALALMVFRALSTSLCSMTPLLTITATLSSCLGSA
ncbi:Uncharacterised protein [Vibrio cholerae]|nr:Uncharacterised protein [Vibrio cholerae]